MVSAESQAAMDNATKAVREFMAKNGRHNTSVYELVRPAVYHETIARTEKEEVVHVLDQERHQTHFHTSVQPIIEEETLEVYHHERISPVEKETFEHDDREEVRLRLDAEHAKFQNHVDHIEGERTREVVPAVVGEHTSHHIREYIQPVVEKRIIEPHVIHEIHLRHEVHHNASFHHKTSILPAVSMADFLRQGGVLTGREERFDFFEGEPRSIGGNLGHPETSNGTDGAAAAHKTASNGVAPQEHATSAAPQGSTATNEPAPASTPAPPFPIPERRSTIPPHQQQQQQQPTADNSTPPAAQSNKAPTASPTDTSPGAGPAHPGAGGRWSLLPMTLARSGGDTAHPPTRAAPAGSVMQAIHPPRPSVDQQRQASVARAGGATAADPRKGPNQQQ